MAISDVGQDLDGWLYPSHKNLHEGVVECLGWGRHTARHRVPTSCGRIVLNGTFGVPQVNYQQSGELGMVITDSSVSASVTNVRQEHTGDILSLSGIIMATGRRDEQYETAPNTQALPIGYVVEVGKGRPYELRAIQEGGVVQAVELPDYRMAQYFIEIVATVMAADYKVYSSDAA